MSKNALLNSYKRSEIFVKCFGSYNKRLKFHSSTRMHSIRQILSNIPAVVEIMVDAHLCLFTSLYDESEDALNH